MYIVRSGETVNKNNALFIMLYHITDLEQSRRQKNMSGSERVKTIITIKEEKCIDSIQILLSDICFFNFKNKQLFIFQFRAPKCDECRT